MTRASCRCSPQHLTRRQYEPVAADIRARAERLLASLPPEPPADVARRRAALLDIGGNGRNQHTPEPDDVAAGRGAPHRGPGGIVRWDA